MITEAVSLYPKFRNAKGELTWYALSCGYIQRASDTGNYVSATRYVDLWHESGPCVHVRYMDRDKGIRNWTSYNSLTEARKIWHGIVSRQNLRKHS